MGILTRGPPFSQKLLFLESGSHITQIRWVVAVSSVLGFFMGCTSPGRDRAPRGGDTFSKDACCTVLKLCEWVWLGPIEIFKGLFRDPDPRGH